MAVVKLCRIAVDDEFLRWINLDSQNTFAPDLILNILHLGPCRRAVVLDDELVKLREVIAAENRRRELSSVGDVVFIVHRKFLLIS